MQREILRNQIIVGYDDAGYSVHLRRNVSRSSIPGTIGTIRFQRKVRAVKIQSGKFWELNYGVVRDAR